jgi:hypothetical protein
MNVSLSEAVACNSDIISVKTALHVSVFRPSRSLGYVSCTAWRGNAYANFNHQP